MKIQTYTSGNSVLKSLHFRYPSTVRFSFLTKKIFLVDLSCPSVTQTEEQNESQLKTINYESWWSSWQGPFCIAHEGPRIFPLTARASPTVRTGWGERMGWYFTVNTSLWWMWQLKKNSHMFLNRFPTSIFIL